VLATSYKAVNSNHVFIYRGLAAVFNEKFQAISGHISELVGENQDYY